MSDTKIIECPHKDQTLYVYEIGDKLELHVCKKCNMILAGEIMKQTALETFYSKED